MSFENDVTEDVSPAQVKAVLQALGNEFLVDLQAVHNKDGYWLEYTETVANLILSPESWHKQIADYINTGEYE